MTNHNVPPSAHKGGSHIQQWRYLACAGVEELSRHMEYLSSARQLDQ